MMREAPALPVSWRMNQAGMQGYEFATPEVAIEAENLWLEAMESAIGYAERMDELGIHKQTVNRLTEPFAHIKVVVTSVYWDNWNGLRNHHAAEPTIAALAEKVWEAREDSTPVMLGRDQWHLPYVSAEDAKMFGVEIARKVSAARCARVSYNNHDGTRSEIDKDIALHDRLLIDQPIHASPAEHQATPDFRVNARGMWLEPQLHGNLHGWRQYRKLLENENMDAPVG